MSVEEVKRKLEFSVEKCLEQFDRVENRNQSAMKEKERGFEAKCQQLQGRIVKLERRENELVGNLKNIKLNKQLSEIEIN
jgi:predicted RNA-binding protein with RPS1 domain